MRRGALDIRALRPGLPPLLLLVWVALVLLAAYSARPFVAVDIGARDDYVYLQGFHAREFSPVAPERTFAWPQGAASLTIDQPLGPAFRMATLTLDQFAPSSQFPRRLIAVYVNEQRLTTLSDRGGNRAFRVLLPQERGDGLTMRVEALPDKTLDIPPVQVEQVQLTGARTYRWTDGRGVIHFPAIGRGPLRVELGAAVFHPDGQPVGARLLANGAVVAALPDYADARRLSVLLPERVADGDLTLEITSGVFSDPRPLGVLIDDVTITPADLGSGQRAMLPPWSALLAGVVVALGAYGALRALATPRWASFGLAALALALGAWAITTYRAPMGLYLQPLALLIAVSALLTPALDRLVAWVFRRLDLQIDARVRRALMLIFVVGLWLKGGGIVFPSMRAIDISWHMDRVRWILAGNLAEIYKPGAFSESVMPINEWGPNRPVIPYSPFFHIFATVFALLRWWPMELSANLFSAVLDCSRVFLIAILARKSGFGQRATVLAALAYAVAPFTFLLHSWGNVPTTFGMWWTLLATVVIVALYPRLERPGPLALLTLVTLLTLLFYTVMAVFYVLFVIAFLLIMRVRPAAVDRRPLRAVALATALAIVLSLVIYYGQYIPGIVERTLPYMTSVATQGSESVGVTREPFSKYLWSYVPHLDYHMWPGDFLYYGVAIPALFAVPGFLALRGRPLLWGVLASWFTVAVFFLFAGYRISMVDKQLFYVFPAICLCWAVYAERYWRRGAWARVMVSLLYAFTLVSALDLWVIRILRSPVE